MISHIETQNPADTARRIAARVKWLRLQRGWSQQEVANRAGVSLPTYRLFERTGQVSLERLIRVAGVLDARRGFEDLFSLPPAQSMAELESRADARTRKRGRTRA
jgi:transcriptional regulator with XRE-family HTH domain